MKVLLTGAAGFIGMHTARRLLAEGHQVIGVDNFNDYYEVSLKKARLAQLLEYPAFHIHEIDVADGEALAALFQQEQPERVLHLAAQAGVRYSLEQPQVYVQSNLVGFGNILECCRQHQIEHLVYASSSSVYGGRTDTRPFTEDSRVDRPISLYAATKAANELMAHSYSHLFSLPCTGLRFFTVYGPWGRPDMALFLFTRAMLKGEEIPVFNRGEMVRDFTYIDDVVDALLRVLVKTPLPESPGDGMQKSAPYQLLNIGNGQPTLLMEYIDALEEALGVSARKKLLPMQPGDVPLTSADTSALEAWTGFRPNTSVREGVRRFVEWYRQYYEI